VTAHRPARGVPGYVWERWILAGGGVIEIIAEVPRPAGAARGRVGVIWQCTACPYTAPVRVRYATTRARALADLIVHARRPTTPPPPGHGPVELPPGWTPLLPPASRPAADLESS
jgi:hypothetical protein